MLRSEALSEQFCTDCRFQLAKGQAKQNTALTKQEAVMKEADLFRQYSREAVRSSSGATSENEKQALMVLACTWAQAALISEKETGQAFMPSLRRQTPKETYPVF